MNDKKPYPLSPSTEYRRVSDHEKEETQKEIAKHLKTMNRHLFWISIFIGILGVVYLYVPK